MQEMKKIIYTLLACCLAASCSLKEDNLSFTNRENSYGTFAQCQACVNACYTPLKDFYDVNYLWAVEAPTDLWSVSSRNPDPICNISPAQPGYATTNVWTQCYKGIVRANECIECIATAPIEQSQREDLVAECVVLRALYYYHLTNYFDGVPFYTCMVKDLAVQEQIRLLPRTPANDIRRDLYMDIKNNALPYLDKVKTSKVSGNRAGHALGLMLMAKFAMWYAPENVEERGWTDAEWALLQLEDIYGDFSEQPESFEETYPLDDTKWSVKNTDESIFEIQHEWTATGIKFNGKMCRAYYPTGIGKKWDAENKAYFADEYDSYIDGIYMPQWGKQLSSLSVMRATWHMGAFRAKSGGSKEESTSEAFSYGDRLFDPLPLKLAEELADGKRWAATIDTEALLNGVNSKGQKIDRRIRYVLGLGDMDPSSETFGQTFRTVMKDGYVFPGEKFWVPNMLANYDSNNYKILRYADALLMMAEVKLMQGQDEDALTYLNIVRSRAAVDPFTKEDFPTDDKMKLIRDERARELAGELHRKYDLVRWGIWHTETKKYVPHEGAWADNVKRALYYNVEKFREYCPIPDTECALTIDPATGVPALSNPAYAGIAVEPETDNNIE